MDVVRARAVFCSDRARKRKELWIRTDAQTEVGSKTLENVTKSYVTAILQDCLGLRENVRSSSNGKQGVLRVHSVPQ